MLKEIIWLKNPTPRSGIFGVYEEYLDFYMSQKSFGQIVYILETSIVIKNGLGSVEYVCIKWKIYVDIQQPRAGM